MIDIFSIYNSIVAGNELANLDKGLTFYQADKLKTDILSNNVIEIDIVSAFPTILKILYGKDHLFVKDVFSINDKLKRNILISTTLSDINTEDKLPYRIADLNKLSKVIIFGYIYSKYTDINILEYKKDSLLINGNYQDNTRDDCLQFLDWLSENEVKFHKTDISSYIRVDKTSYFYTDKLTIKGIYKNAPANIVKYIFDLFIGKIYDNSLLNEIKNNYSVNNLYILVKSGLIQNYQELFMFNDDQYLSFDNKLKIMSTGPKILSNCDPLSYLKFIIFPILALLRLQK